MSQIQIQDTTASLRNAADNAKGVGECARAHKHCSHWGPEYAATVTPSAILVLIRANDSQRLENEWLRAVLKEARRAGASAGHDVLLGAELELGKRDRGEVVPEAYPMHGEIIGEGVVLNPVAVLAWADDYLMPEEISALTFSQIEELMKRQIAIAGGRSSGSKNREVPPMNAAGREIMTAARYNEIVNDDGTGLAKGEWKLAWIEAALLKNPELREAILQQQGS